MSKAILCKLLGLFVLSVAIAACSSDSGSNGGSSGSGGGGGGGGGGELVDQCVNEPDKGYVESGTIHEAARACGAGDCLEIVVKLFTGTPTDEDIDAAATCIADCVLADGNVDGVSEGCAQCFGIQGSCGAVAGCLECSNPDSCKCVECLDDSGCQAEVNTCTGVIREFECTP
jgi:hypothetical protein